MFDLGNVRRRGPLAGAIARKTISTRLNRLRRLPRRFIARFAESAGMPIVLTSSMETAARKPQRKICCCPTSRKLPDEYEDRIKRTGVISAWEDPAFAKAVADTGKKNILMGGMTTDVCIVPPAISATKAGFNVIALLDISGAVTKLGAEKSKLYEPGGKRVLRRDGR